MLCFMKLFFLWCSQCPLPRRVRAMENLFQLLIDISMLHPLVLLFRYFAIVPMDKIFQLPCSWYLPYNHDSALYLLLHSIPAYLCMQPLQVLVAIFSAMNPAGLLYISNIQFLSVYLNKGNSFPLEDICLTSNAHTDDHHKVDSMTLDILHYTVKNFNVNTNTWKQDTEDDLNVPVREW